MQPQLRRCGGIAIVGVRKRVQATKKVRARSSGSGNRITIGQSLTTHLLEIGMMKLAKLYVTGGQQRNARSMLEGDAYWYKYHKGLILEVDTVTGQAERRAEYVSPPDVCADEDPAILFKCGTMAGDKLYVSTQTEVLVYNLPDFTLGTYISLPCFNDVHHVRPSRDGHLLVANSGLDMVLEITSDGEVLRIWNTLGEDPWSRVTQEADYRRVTSLKPHRSHPNHIFYLGDEPWVTRFEQRDACSLTNPVKRIDIGIERVHDGHLFDGHLYFTTVNGCIAIANVETLQVEEVIDLNTIAPPDVVLGWCRGLLVEDGTVWVGFSRLRLTKIRRNISWVRQGFRQLLPTRIACYDLRRRTCITEIDLQEHGLDAVFSIFPVPEPLRSAATPAMEFHASS